MLRKKKERVSSAQRTRGWKKKKQKEEEYLKPERNVLSEIQNCITGNRGLNKTVLM